MARPPVMFPSKSKQGTPPPKPHLQGDVVHQGIYGLSGVTGCAHVDIGARGRPCAKRQAVTSLWSSKMDEDWSASALAATCMAQGSSSPVISKMSGAISNRPWLTAKAVPKPPVVNTLTLVPVEDPAAKRQALTSLWPPKMDEDWPASASQ